MKSLWVIALTSVAAMWGGAVVDIILALAQTRGTYSALAIIATVILGGVVGGLNRKMPNYMGRPHLSSLRRHLKAPYGAAVLALVLMLGIAILLTMRTPLDPWHAWALYAAGALNFGLLIVCASVSVELRRQFREACAWEDRVNQACPGE